MAYTLTDPFRSLRAVLRLSGATDLLCGSALLLLPKATLAAWNIAPSGPVWPVRLAGAALLALGLFYLLSASERLIGAPTMIASAVGNALVALVLLVAYVQQDLIGLSIFGLVLFVTIFVICLVGAVAPLRYLRAEYRPD